MAKDGVEISLKSAILWVTGLATGLGAISGAIAAGIVALDTRIAYVHGQLEAERREAQTLDLLCSRPLDPETDAVKAEQARQLIASLGGCPD